MNYNKLRYFYTVAGTLNLTKAASQLYMSQSVVSRHISDLERELGVELFRRTNRNLVLTPAGEVLLEECAPFFSRENEILQRLREVREREHGQLCLAFLNTRYSGKLMEVRGRFEEKYPHIQLLYRREDWSNVIRSVQLGEADLGVVVRNEGESQYTDDMEHIVLLEDRLSLVVPERHPFTRLPQVGIRQLAGEDIVVVSPRDEERQYQSTLRLFQDAGVRPRIVAEYPNIESTLVMVGAGAGVSVQSPFAPIDSIQGIRNVPLEGAPAIYLDLVWRSNAYNVVVGYLVNLILDQVR